MSVPALVSRHGTTLPIHEIWPLFPSALVENTRYSVQNDATRVFFSLALVPRTSVGLPPHVPRLLHNINVTLDGRCDHQLAVADDEHHGWVTRVLEQASAVLLGRTTYELFARHWPAVAKSGKGSPSEVAFARALDAKPRFVASRRLQQATWPGTSILAGDLRESLATLRQRVSGDVLVLGSPGLGRSLTEIGAVDEWQLMIQPMLGGRGRVLYDGLAQRLDLELVETRRFRSGVTLARYAARRRA